jgi:hypothetical protein
VEVADLRSTAPQAPGPAPLPDNARLTDVLRRRAPRAFAAPPSGRSAEPVARTHSVTVVHGDTATSVDVPTERLGAGA